MSEETQITAPEVSSTQRKYLRGLAHALKPVASVGKGLLTESFLREVNEAISHHELVKVKFLEGKGEKKELAQKLAAGTNSALAGLVGNIAILYRPHLKRQKSSIKLPKNEVSSQEG